MLHSEQARDFIKVEILSFNIPSQILLFSGNLGEQCWIPQGESDF